MTSLTQRILSALAYHDVCDVPLTAQEIFFALPAPTLGQAAAAATLAPPTLEDVERALEALRRAGQIATSHGLYFLPGREALPGLRRTRYAVAEGKYRRAKRFLSLACHAPYVRAVFACNTLARSNARAESDIDLYVVVATGRLWFARLFVTGLAALLGIRPTPQQSADRLCLSFFVAADALNLSSLAIENDIYLSYWLHDLYPLYDEAGIASGSFEANAWLRGVFPATLAPVPSPRRALPSPRRLFKPALERLFDAVSGDRLERWAKRLQLAWMPPSLRAAAATPATDVLLTETVLKFHDGDRRAEIRDAYLKKRREILSSHPGEGRNLKTPASAGVRAHELRALA